jgi:hypothetical protein
MRKLTPCYSEEESNEEKRMRIIEESNKRKTGGIIKRF